MSMGHARLFQLEEKVKSAIKRMVERASGTTILKSGTSWGQVGYSMATSVFALIPTLIIFLFTQNKMIDGLATTGVKK